MQDQLARSSFNVRNINPEISSYIKVSAIQRKQTIPEFLTNLCELHKDMSISEDAGLRSLLSNHDLATK